MVPPRVHRYHAKCEIIVCEFLRFFKKNVRPNARLHISLRFGIKASNDALRFQKPSEANGDNNSSTQP